MHDIARKVKISMRMVLDTDAVVAAMHSPCGASATPVQAAGDGRVQLLDNVALVLEYEAVCARVDHLTVAGLDIRKAGRFVDAFAALAEPLASHFIWRPHLKDLPDEMVLGAAANGRAQAIVSTNLRDFRNVPNQFGIRILLPRDACGRIME